MLPLVIVHGSYNKYFLGLHNKTKKTWQHNKIYRDFESIEIGTEDK